MATPWLTSDDLIKSVKLNIMFPISQSTFTEDDILSFANKEMATSQVPSILQFHEEFFVTTFETPLVPNQSTYPIPNRAIGLKLRDLMYRDTSGNLTEMTRITGDEDIFTYGSGSGTPPYKFKLQGNDVVLVPVIGSQPVGTLVFVYYLRPNQLVRNSRAATISAFTKSVQLINSSIVAGDTITLTTYDQVLNPTATVFTAVSGSPSANEFQIGATSIDTASNLVTAINTNGAAFAVNGTPATDTVKFQLQILNFTIQTSNSSGFSIASTDGIEFTSIPANITNGSVIDFLQTKPGHKIRAFDITLGLNAISNTNIQFQPDDIPGDIEVGDYICSENECIIPQIPSDLHEVLAERTSARIQKALGDQAGLQATQGKIQEMEANQAKLIDNRAEGTPQKILGRHTILKIMARRRSHLRGW